MMHGSVSFMSATKLARNNSSTHCDIDNIGMTVSNLYVTLQGSTTHVMNNRGIDNKTYVISVPYV
jgi:hypothetical protein